MNNINNNINGDNLDDSIKKLNAIMSKLIPNEYKKNIDEIFHKIEEELLPCINDNNIIDFNSNNGITHKIIKKDFINEKMYKSLANNILETIPFISIETISILVGCLYGIKTSLWYHEWELDNKGMTYESYKDYKYKEEKIFEKMELVGELCKKPVVGDQSSESFMHAALEIKKILHDILFIFDKGNLLDIQSILISLVLFEAAKLEGKPIDVG